MGTESSGSLWEEARESGGDLEKPAHCKEEVMRKRCSVQKLDADPKTDQAALSRIWPM